MSTPSPDPEAERAARLFEEGLAASAPGAGARRPPEAREVAPLFPNLELIDVIGVGGMGVVYKARQPRLDRLVALKILWRDLAEDPAFAERFQREARALAHLDHPNIVRVYDFGETEGLYWLLLEHVDGANLRQVMTGGRLEPKEALAIVPRICDALQYAHEQGVVHRDIKPENVLIDEKGRVKIADFGLAKLAATGPGATLTGTHQVMGTWQYMAPEQARSPQDVDHRADIFSLGVVFYEMLTGELPVGRFAAPSASGALDRRVDAIVMKALERERELRYQQASEVRTALESVGSEPDRRRAEARGERGRHAERPMGDPEDAHSAARRGGAGLLLGGLLPVPLAIALLVILGEGRDVPAGLAFGLLLGAWLLAVTCSAVAIARLGGGARAVAILILLLNVLVVPLGAATLYLSAGEPVPQQGEVPAPAGAPRAEAPRRAASGDAARDVEAVRSAIVETFGRWKALVDDGALTVAEAQQVVRADFVERLRRLDDATRAAWIERGGLGLAFEAAGGFEGHPVAHLGVGGIRLRPGDPSRTRAAREAEVDVVSAFDPSTALATVVMVQEGSPARWVFAPPELPSEAPEAPEAPEASAAPER